MLDRFTRRLYLRLGPRYRFVFPLVQDHASLLVATVTVVLLTSYYDPSGGELLIVLCAVWLSTAAGVWYAHWRAQPHLARVVAWQTTEHPSAEQSVAAWDAATNFPMRSFRGSVVLVGLIITLPAVVAMVLTLDLSWGAAPVILAATIPPLAYGTVVNYFIAEVFMRPVVEDIARDLPEDFPFAASGLLIRKRLKIVLPVFTTFVGLVVAALMTGDGGTRTLGLSVLAAAGVALVVSYELTVLLSRSVTAPVARLRRAMEQVRGGDYSARVPVVTSDELGDLSQDFNLMALGLGEREQLREAFGTYLDREIVSLILSGRFPREGVAVTVSIMFVDVRGFTAFAERADPTEVVAALNELFEVIVPIVAEHGGHVDKFLGDGLLAAFGAPEGYKDHADRAVAAGLEIVRAINRPGAELYVGVGVNTGRVVAGSIGGAGRLNFSLIGDPVNVSARVEAATRETGDDMLVTAATRDALTRPLPLVSRGTMPLKGKSEPVEILACLGVGAGDGDQAALSAPVARPGR